jgi:type III pantothenate kinase
MVLAIDVGNTRIKGAVFEDAMLLEVFVFTASELQKNIQNILKK